VNQDANSLHEAVRAIVVEELEIEPDELTDGALFEDEYGADSLSLLAIVARFENELGILVPSERLGDMLSFDQVIAVVDELSGAAAHA
jgi:acyl carrier protein